MAGNATASTDAPVFLSYARKTSAQAVHAVQAALKQRGIEALLDIERFELGDKFPRRISDGILGARVLVAFVDETYFERWYCIREWELGLASFSAAIEGGLGEAEREAALSHVIVVLPATGSNDIANHLPVGLEHTLAPVISDPDAVVEVIAKRLEQLDRSIGERAVQLGASNDVLGALRNENARPPANLRGRTVAPLIDLPQTLGDRFVGRADELWCVHHRLSTSRGNPSQHAALTCALYGGGGYGKTRLAREYFHRFAPWYSGGLFWMDARAEESDRLRRYHEFLAALRRPEETISLADYLQGDLAGERLIRELAFAVQSVPPAQRILWVIDNVPEVEPPPLTRWCPIPGQVSILATTRATGLADVSRLIPVQVLSPVEARGLLLRGLAFAIDDTEADSVTEWVGCLPLALEILNASLHLGTLTWEELLAHAHGNRPAVVTDDQLVHLQGRVSDTALKGIAATFEISLQALDDSAREAARILAWLSPAPLPQALIDHVCLSCGDLKSVRRQLFGTSLLATVENENASASPLREMHGLVSDYIRRAEDHAPALSLLVTGLADLSNPEASSLWMPAMSRVLQYTDRERLDRPVAEPLFALGRWLVETGQQWGRLDLAREAPRPYRLLVDNADTPDRRAYYEINLAVARRILGEIAGDPTVLQQAVEAYEAALQFYSEKHTPADWAMTQNNLGNACGVLGRMAGDPKVLQRAVDAYQAALRVYSEKHTPADWAMTQNNLGNARRALGEMAGDPKVLQQAVKAYEAALRVRSEKDNPGDWAMTQSNLGDVCGALGEMTGDRKVLRQAGEAFEASLRVFTQEHSPAAWAKTQNGLALALQTLGEIARNPGVLQQAVNVHEAVLRVRSEKDTPAAWAVTQNNLGNARAILGQMRGDAKMLQQAIEAYEAALRVRSGKDTPVAWAMTQNNLGNTLRALGQSTGDPKVLQQSVEALEAALRVYTEEYTPAAWAGTLANLGFARRVLGEMTGDPKVLQQAVEAYEAALRAYSEEQTPAAWAMTQKNLASCKELLKKFRQ